MCVTARFSGIRFIIYSYQMTIDLSTSWLLPFMHTCFFNALNTSSIFYLFIHIYMIFVVFECFMI
jgi:hypothetical protein